MPKTVTIPFPFKTITPQINETITPEILQSDAFKPNSIGEVVFGPLNNEKSVNTTVFANGITTIILNKDATITYQLPTKIQGDHMKLHIPSGWKEEGKVICATALLNIVITLEPVQLNVPIDDFAINAHAHATVPSFQVQVEAPLAGIVDKLTGTKVSAKIINLVIAPKFREINVNEDELLRPAEDLKKIPIVGSIAHKVIVKGCRLSISNDGDSLLVHLDLGM
jgi:hypothetical protein